MADMLTIGTQATRTFKTALDVTSHNVANVNTEGYSRQRADIVSSTPNLAGSTYLGGGSAVSSIERINAEYIQNQLYTSQSLVQRYESSYSLATQVEGIVAGNDEGVKDFMQRFFDSLQTVASNPTSEVSRQLLLDEAGSLQSHVGNLTNVLESLESQTNTQLKDLTTEVNDRLKTIQSINDEVARALSVGSQAPNDLLDQRDQAILELSKYIDIDTYPQQDGTIEIHTGGGKVPLISDNNATYLQAAQSPYPDEGRIEIYTYIGGARQVITDKITGGELGGVIDFRTEMLDKAQNDLGLTINGMVASMNWQHYQGWDLNGDPGQSLFTPLSADVLKSSNNADGSSDGSGISVTFNPVKPTATTPEPPFTTQPTTYDEKQAYLDNAMQAIGEFESREYELRYDESLDGGNGGFYVLDRNTRELLGDFAKNSSTTIDGLEFKGDNGTYSQGDSFIVQPHKDILEDFATLIQEPNEIAARGQSPLVQSLTPYYNEAIALGAEDTDSIVTYSSFIAATGIDDTDPLGMTVAEFNSVFSAEVSGDGGDLLDTDGDGTISQLEFDDATTGFMSFASPAPAAYGDNTNMANIASLQSKDILLSDDNGNASSTLLGGYSIMASNVGLYVRSTDIQLTAQENVFQQIVDRRESLSGVSLDEEAANLLRYQQAYEASAQIISTAQSLFQTLISVVRG
ncbi:flagellar hook-associated protein FlgK [Thiomicrorhabdus sp. 6S2-11]|uniref:Flagellar hook-associated protein 1 n=1 Tax=Thiomicrorhabdus marina TaxID=2818442 RepID=A0ABS3Q824_9GAMM|nr:flagellar hook-associated protein FlgK [Thiomicrorhabdus marina]MBO1928457.1 flagellar hook-associated protein FlgK [Thiomicrorhabdus marina]